MKINKLICKYLSSHPKTIACLLGGMCTYTLPPFYSIPLLFICYSGLLLLLNHASAPRQAFVWGYNFGFIYFACNLSWIGNALLINPIEFGWLYPLCLLASGAFFGLFTAFPALISFYFRNLYSKWLSFSAVWVIFEWIRSFIFTGFPWNLSGSVLAFSDYAIQPASLIGTYGLSLLVIMIASAPALFINHSPRRLIIFPLLFILLMPALIYGYGYRQISHYRPSASALNIRIVQPAIPQAMKWQADQLLNNFHEYITLSQRPGLDNIDFVIWGETATPYALDFEPQKLQEITAAVPQNGYLITGLVRYQWQNQRFKPANSMFVIDKKAQIINYYDKSHLVPFGEYIPLQKYLPRFIKPLTNVVGNFASGSGPKVMEAGHHPSFGGSICYEIIFPHQIINPHHRPEWLVNLTNDGWYGYSSGPYQHLVTTRLRAIEEGITIVRAANSGISAAISPYGQILASIPLGQKDIIDVKLPHPLNRPTPYADLGNFLPLTLCLLNIIIALYLRRKV